MKSTGIVRPLDKVGRVVLPVELRRVFDLNPCDYIEIYTAGNKIVLEKYNGSKKGLKAYIDKKCEVIEDDE